tara:strand:+ start:193 stop:330 length:138 start_codon:yes stop_codon:yes gene_type:complete
MWFHLLDFGVLVSPQLADHPWMRAPKTDQTAPENCTSGMSLLFNK